MERHFSESYLCSERYKAKLREAMQILVPKRGKKTRVFELNLEIIHHGRLTSFFDIIL